MPSPVISEFRGVIIGKHRFAEHADSIIARSWASTPVEPFYAYPGCGTPNKRNQLTFTLTELCKMHKGIPKFINKDPTV